MHKIKISPGVSVTVDNQELVLLKCIKKVRSFPYNKLNSTGKCVINKLLSKGLITRSKKGDHVTLHIHGKIFLPKNQ